MAFAMTAQLIDGRSLAAEVKNQVRGKIEAALARGSRRPALAVVKVGDDPASEVYVRNKRRACEEVGIRSVAHDLAGSTSEVALLSLIDELNRDAAGRRHPGAAAPARIRSSRPPSSRKSTR